MQKSAHRPTPISVFFSRRATLAGAVARALLIPLALALAAAAGWMSVARGADDALPAPKPAPDLAKPGTLPPVRKGPSELDKIAPYRRCLWVTRWDYHTPEDVAKICYNAASARFTDIMFQVRGAGTVFYPSDLEPWSGELSARSDTIREQVRDTGWDPGWDPLATAIKESRRWGLRIHAYLNVLPGWNANEAPATSTGQMWAVHRSWFMMDAQQDRMMAGNWYTFVDPALPEVRAHLAAVFAEVAKKYPLDGVHLDYIRYPHEAGDFSYNPSTLISFERIFNGSPRTMPRQWQEFRQAQVSATVEAISKAVRAARPGIEVSAAVMGDLKKGTQEGGQSALEWIRQGWLDAIAPMAYTDDVDHFADLCSQFKTPEIRKHVWLGVWAEADRNSHLKVEVEKAADKGFGAVAVFSYSDLYPAHKASSRAVGVYQAFVRGAD